MNTRWLNSQELSTWVRFASILELLPGMLDSQLRKDSDLTHFDYRVLAMLSESEDTTLSMTFLSQITNSTLPRLSHVVQRLEAKGHVVRSNSTTDRRITNVSLTDAGLENLREAAHGHVELVRDKVMDAIEAEELDQLASIFDRILHRIDPAEALKPVYVRHDDHEAGSGVIKETPRQ